MNFTSELYYHDKWGERGKGGSLLGILSFPFWKTFSVLPKLVYFASSSFFFITGMVDGRQLLNNGWMNNRFHFIRITPSGDKEQAMLLLTGFETITSPESQVWPHWICVGNANWLDLCTPVKIPKGPDARKMPYFVRKYISHTAAGLA